MMIEINLERIKIADIELELNNVHSVTAYNSMKSNI